MRDRMVRAAVGLGLALAVADVALIVTDRGVLIREHRVKAGESYVVEDLGDLGAGGDTLYCRYFTGRAVAGIAYWYSPNNIIGRRACPFMMARE